jgi:acyl-CoA dehydrogenase
VVLLGRQRRDLALVMARTDPDAPRHQQFSTFIVELPNPGYRIKRDIPTMAAEGPLSHIMGGGHAEIEIKDLVVPAENLLGGEGRGFDMGQHRLAYGRLRHGMHNVAMAQRALDMAAAHVTNRETFGKKLRERQAVQFMLAECATQLYISRLMLLHIAYKAEKGADLRQEKLDRQGLPGATWSTTWSTPPSSCTAPWATAAIPRWRPGTPTSARNGWSTDPTRCTAGPSGRNVIKAFQKDGTTAMAAGRRPALGVRRSDN